MISPPYDHNDHNDRNDYALLNNVLFSGLRAATVLSFTDGALPGPDSSQLPINLGWRRSCGAVAPPHYFLGNVDQQSSRQKPSSMMSADAWTVNAQTLCSPACHPARRYSRDPALGIRRSDDPGPGAPVAVNGRFVTSFFPAVSARAPRCTEPVPELIPRRHWGAYTEPSDRNHHLSSPSCPRGPSAVVWVRPRVTITRRADDLTVAMNQTTVLLAGQTWRGKPHG